MPKVNRKLKARIIERFGTQADFAQACGENAPKVSLVVNYRERLKPKEKRRWARLLDTRPEKIFPGE
jgi:hypothetical protein